MNIDQLIAFMNVAEKLKCNTRHSWTSSGRHESVAEHSWRMTLFAMAISEDFKHLDMNKVIKMCIIHDLGEAYTGDIPSFYKTERDETVENQKIAGMLAGLEGEFKQEMTALYREMDAMESEEAKLYKCIDKCEVVLQHNEAPLDTWIELEYELNKVHGAAECEVFAYMKKLRERLKEDTERKLAEGGVQ